jgi:protein-tyrosine phosphatase
MATASGPNELTAAAGRTDERSRFTPAKHGGNRTITGTGDAAPKLEAMSSADLHFHLLFGVDDGPADFAESLHLARAAAAEGTRTIVATPHVRFDLGTTDAVEIRQRVCELRARLAGSGPAVEVLCGGELGHDVVGSLGQDELELLAQGPPGARWLLLEAPFEGIGAEFHVAAAELRHRGFGVLIAHPERSAGAAVDAARGLRRELAAGSRTQMNAQSLTGQHGEDARAAAWRMIEDDLVAVIASDAHGPTRPPGLAAARRALLEAGVARPKADMLVMDAPWRLLSSGIRSSAALAA